MRLVFVNHAHPDVPHVSGMRFGYFAAEMAIRGHQVVLLTGPLPGSKSLERTTELSERLVKHDWSRPLVVAVPPVRRRALELIRQNRVPSTMRRAMTAWQFIAYGGLFADWQKGAEETVARLASQFKPDLVWGTFGNTTNLAVAQKLARRAGCPWIIDIKDNWTLFIPRAVRRLLAWRFRDAAGQTSNSRYYREVAAPWFRLPRSEVIYSGVAEEFFVRPEARSESKRHQLLLVGGIYDGRRLDAYLQGVRGWLESLPPEDRMAASFVYAGADGERVADALNATPLPCTVRIMGFLCIRDFAQLADGCFANSYLALSLGFHHKLLELLARGRPVICYPSERAESKELASRSGTLFLSCETSSQLRDAIATAWSIRDRDNRKAEFPAWRWRDFAQELGCFFQEFPRRDSE